MKYGMKFKYGIFILVVIVLILFSANILFSDNASDNLAISNPGFNSSEGSSLGIQTENDEFNPAIKENLKLLRLEDETKIVRMKSSGFYPKEIVIKKGEMIVWINEDLIPHSVTYSLTDSQGSEFFNSGPLEPNMVFSMSFSEIIDVNYSDEYSLNAGRIIVED